MNRRGFTQAMTGLLGDVARACRVNVAYRCRLFKRLDHQGPQRYLLSLRMRDAARRLAAPHASVKEVADALG